jgi:hypothetical protein
MPLHYDPKAATSAWPEGEYPASLESVTDTHSKSTGAQMQVWAFRVYHPDGRDMLLKDYVVEATAFKIKNLAKALGRLADFDSGKFQADDHQGASVGVKLKIEEGKDGYDDKNKIVSFLPYKTGSAPAAAPVTLPPKMKPALTPDAPVADDDSPF